MKWITFMFLCGSLFRGSSFVIHPVTTQITSTTTAAALSRTCLYNTPPLSSFSSQCSSTPIKSTKSRSDVSKSSLSPYSKNSNPRLSRQIEKCGRNHEKVLILLYQAYPYLKSNHNHTTTDIKDYHYVNMNMNNDNNDDDNGDDEWKKQPIDGKCISSVIGILGRTQQSNLLSNLLQSTLNVYLTNRKIITKHKSKQNHKHEHYDAGDDFNHEDDTEIMTCIRAAISAYGSLHQSDTALFLLQYTVPHTLQLSPKLPLYHAAISALGKNHQLDQAFQLVDELETSSKNNENENNNDDDMKNILKPDRMVYHTMLTVLLRYKAQSQTQNQTHAHEHTHAQTPNNPSDSDIDVNDYIPEMISSILQDRMPQQNIPPNPMTFNLAIMASVKQNQISLALELLHQAMTMNTNMNTNMNATMAMNMNTIKTTTELIDMDEGIDVSLVEEPTYQAIISACGRHGQWRDATRVTNYMERAKYIKRFGSDDGFIPTTLSLSTQSHPAFTSVSISTSLDDNKDNNLNDKNDMTHYYDHLNDFPQIGEGKLSWWELGRWYHDLDHMTIMEDESQPPPQKSSSSSSFIYKPKCIRIGIQPHRNPVKNGLTLVFYDAFSNEKIGFVLLRNKLRRDPFGDGGDNSDDSNGKGTKTILVSALYGMKILPIYRGLGLSNLFISCWLKLCLEMLPPLNHNHNHNHNLNSNDNPNYKIVVETEQINKPLIAKVLQHRFGFVPMKPQQQQDHSYNYASSDAGGVDVQIVPLSQCNFVPEPNDDCDHDWNGNGKGNENDSNIQSTQPKFALISTSRKPLNGVFSERDLRIQGMILLPRHYYNPPPPSSDGKKDAQIFRVKSCLEHPAFSNNHVSLQNEKTKKNHNEMSSGIRSRSSSGCGDDAQQYLTTLKQQVASTLKRRSRKTPSKRNHDTNNHDNKDDDRMGQKNIQKQEERGGKGGVRFLSDSTALKRAFFGYLDRSLL